MPSKFQFHERHWVRYLKFIVDIASLQFCLFLAWLFRAGVSPWFSLDVTVQRYWDLAFTMLLVPVGYWFFGLYPGYGMATVERLRRRVRATFVFFMAFISWDYLADHTWRSRGILLVTLCFAVFIPPVFQYLLKQILLKCNCWGKPVLVLGAGKTGKCVVSALQSDRGLGLHPLIILDDDPSLWGTNVDGLIVGGPVTKAKDYIDRMDCVLVAIPGAGRERIAELSRNLPFFSVMVIPDLMGIQSLWVEARDLGGIIGLELQKNLLLRRNRYLKHFMDYLLGVPFFIMSIPLLAAACFWIVVKSPGNPFYCQIREGKGGRKFKVWKLRTMYLNAEKLLHEYLETEPTAKQEWQLYFKLKNDPRILPGIGELLRKSSLDELPQLWNVLRGEMSLVGPRPFPHYHLEQFNEGFRRLRRSVIPGMTGLWQVSARSDGNLDVQENLDTYYIRNWSIWLDLYLLARTALVVFSGKGAY